MIETGIARQLDAVGRITLPKELRKSLGFKDRELLEIYTENVKDRNRIFLLVLKRI